MRREREAEKSTGAFLHLSYSSMDSMSGLEIQHLNNGALGGQLVDLYSPNIYTLNFSLEIKADS